MQNFCQSKFIAERLTQARKARGLTAISLADLVGITSGAISKYERSKNAPKSETLKLLADKLNFPQSFFYTPIGDSIDKKCFKWRSLATATKFSRERGEAKYEWVARITSYFSNYFDFPEVNIPTIDLPRDFREIKSSDIDRAAQLCREFWGIGFSPIKDLVLLLENNGIIVTRLQLGADKQDAFSEWEDGDFPYIFLGTDKNVCVRSRFDAAHELGHLILHRSVRKEDYKNPALNKLIEKQAHRFAAEFLIPRREFFKDLWTPSLEAYSALKERWRVSIKGMIVHSHRHGILNDNQYQRMMISYNRKYKEEGEPLDNVWLCEKPRLLSRCVDALINAGIKSKDDILNDLSLYAHDVEEITGVRRGYFSPKNTEVIQFIPKLKHSLNKNTNEKVIDIHSRNKIIFEDD